MNEPHSDAPLLTAASASSGSSRLIGLGLVAGVCVVLATGGFLVMRAEAKVSKVALADSAKPVTVVVANGATYRPSRVYVGTLRPWLEAKVGPQFISAYVKTVLVRPGAVVKEAEVLATLDCRSAGAANQAVAMEAKAIDSQQKALADEAARLRKLLDGGFVSENESEIKTAMSQAQAAQLLSQKAKMQNTALQVSDCILRSPFDAEVATRTLDPGGFARPDTPIVSVVDRSIVRVIGDAPEIDFAVSLTGIVIALMAAGQGFSITALMGILMVIGISVSNGILLIDDANRRFQEGADKVEAIIAGARSRFVPIAMTSLATIIGLIPTGLALERGGEANQPLALAVVGGLTSSTILSLFLCPVMFLFFAKRTATDDVPQDALGGLQPTAIGSG